MPENDDPSRGFQTTDAGAAAVEDLNTPVASSRFGDPPSLTAVVAEQRAANVTPYSPVPSGFVPAADSQTGDGAMRCLCELLTANGIPVDYTGEVGASRWSDIQKMPAKELEALAREYLEFIDTDNLNHVPTCAGWPASAAARFVVGVAVVCAYRLLCCGGATAPEEAALRAAKLTDAQAFAVTLYTHPKVACGASGEPFAFYQVLNLVLAQRVAAAAVFPGKEPLLVLYEALRVAVRQLSTAWRQSSGASYPPHLYRGCRRLAGADLKEDFAPGVVRSWTHFTSLTSLKNTAEDFAELEDPREAGAAVTLPLVLVASLAAPGTEEANAAAKGPVVIAPVAMLSVLPLECEWVLAPNTTYIPRQVFGDREVTTHVRVTLGPTAEVVVRAATLGDDNDDEVVSPDAVAAAARRRRRLYQVQQGETVSKMALAFDVTEDELVACNPRLRKNKNVVHAYSYLEIPEHARIVGFMQPTQAYTETGAIVVNRPQPTGGSEIAHCGIDRAALDLACDGLARCPEIAVDLNADQRQFLVDAFKAMGASADKTAKLVAVHRVAPGQTLTHVAEAYGHPYPYISGADAISKTNPVLNGNPNFVRVGQMLVVPAPPPPHAPAAGEEEDGEGRNEPTHLER